MYIKRCCFYHIGLSAVSVTVSGCERLQFQRAAEDRPQSLSLGSAADQRQRKPPQARKRTSDGLSANQLKPDETKAS